MVLNCVFTITLLHYDNHINFQDKNVVMIKNMTLIDMNSGLIFKFSGMNNKQNDNITRILWKFFELSYRFVFIRSQPENIDFIFQYR